MTHTNVNTTYIGEDINPYSPHTPYEYAPEYSDEDGTTRYERALVLLRGTNNIRKVPNENAWLVRSQKNKSSYYVTYDTTYHCNCPDHVLHHTECKHILAVKMSLSAQKPRVSKQTRDWRTYNEGTCNEFRYFEQYLRELTDIIEIPEQKRGRPSLNIREVTYMTINRVAHQLSSRRGMGLYDAEMGDFNYSATLKFLQNPENSILLRGLLHATAKNFVCLEKNFSIDATGFNTRCYSDWVTDKWSVNHKRQFVKCHIVTGNRTNVITDAVITDEFESDNSQFDTLVDTTNGYFNMKKLLADAGYLDEKNYKKLSKLNIDAMIMFRSDSTYEGKCPSWKKAFSLLVTKPEEFYKEYRKRNNVESTFSALKDKYGESVKSKTLVAQRNEIYCKLIAYNIALIVRYQNEIEGMV